MGQSAYHPSTGWIEVDHVETEPIALSKISEHLELDFLEKEAYRVLLFNQNPVSMNGVYLVSRHNVTRESPTKAWQDNH